MTAKFLHFLKSRLGKSPSLSSMHSQLTQYRLQLLKRDNTTGYDNFYHCCTQKTASQWLRHVFSDPLFVRHSGMLPVPYRKLGLRSALLEKPFPRNTVVTHLYIDYPTFEALPKPGPYKAFFILRDPRDITCSFYYSIKNSHTAIVPIPALRKKLVTTSKQEGIRLVIDTIEQWGLFDAQRSWLNISSETRNARHIKILYYEDLAEENHAFLQSLFHYMEIDIPETTIAKLYKRQRFEVHSGGRPHGMENQQSHYRKGVAGDWRNNFSSATRKILY